MFLVYKYIFENTVIYVGKTNDIVRRMAEHASGLGLEKKFLDYPNADVFVHKCGSEAEMDFLEKALIYFYKPRLNENDADSGEITFEISLEWLPVDLLLDRAFDAEIMSIRKQISANETRIKRYQKEADDISKSLKPLSDFCSFLENNREMLETHGPICDFIGLQERNVPNFNSMYVGDIYVKNIFERIERRDGDCLWVKFTDDFLKAFYVYSWRKDWVDTSLNNAGRSKRNKLYEKITNLSRKNTESENKLKSLLKEN
ncbi:MAG: GIY-YIG nuclease family protein [Lachnospiraceae bacterium]|nr:GIY-YIG nuclease family protein [Lachnospiraceae bacterium]